MVICPGKISSFSRPEGALLLYARPFLQAELRLSSVYVDIKSYSQLCAGSLGVFPAGQIIGFISMHHLL